MPGTSIIIKVILYGPIAKYGGGTHLSKVVLEQETGTKLSSVFARLEIPVEEKGYIFVNSVLCDAPGLNASVNLVLQDGDHIGVFSLNHMWPYQYRDGIKMSDSLREVMRKRGAMHHTYDTTPLD